MINSNTIEKYLNILIGNKYIINFNRVTETSKILIDHIII